MRFLMKVWFSFLVVICLLGTSACGNSLDRGKAQSSISDYILNKYKGIVEIDKNGRHFIKTTCKGLDFQSKYNQCSPPEILFELKNAGLLNPVVVSRYKTPKFHMHTVKFDIEVTDKGKNYLINKQSNSSPKKISFKIYELKNIEIQSVGEPTDFLGHKVSTVNFIANFDITPFGVVLYKNNGNKINGQAQFILTDNGWELDKVQLKKFMVQRFMF